MMTRLDKVRQLQDIFIARATGGDRSDRQYSKLRLELFRDSESVCKHILDEAGISHSDKDDLPKLYYETAKHLNMAPEQHQEEVFKQILGGCQRVIQGLGTLHNNTNSRLVLQQ